MDVSIVRPPLCGDVPGKSVHYDPVVYGNEMFVFLPRKDGVSSEVSALNLDTMTWRKVQTNGTGPCVRRFHASALLNDQMFIIGGRDNIKKKCGDVWVLDLRSLQWKVLIRDDSDQSERKPGPSGDLLQAVRTKGDIYVLCTDSGFLWRLNLLGIWTLIHENAGMNFQWITGNDETLFGVADSGTFRWNFESSSWIQLSQEGEDNCGQVCPQQNSLILWSPRSDILKVLGTEKQWLTVFDIGSVPLCISLENASWYTVFPFRGIVVIVGWDDKKDKDAVWLLSIPYHPSSDIHTPGSDFLTLVDSPYTDFKLVPKEGIEQAVPVIKSVLAVRWKWFANLLQSGMQEVSSGIVHLPKSRNVVAALVNYLYGGCLPSSLPLKTLVGLAKLADMYQLSELTELSSLALRVSLSDENCIEIFRCGVKAHDSVLRWFAADYILERFSKICLTQEYARLIADSETNQAFSTHVPPDMKLSWSTCTAQENKRKRKAA